MTNDLTQCKTCVFYYTDEAGNDMCMQVGDDFYLQWKVKHCPKYRSGSLATLINKLESENAELRARLDKAVELPCKVGDTVYKVYGECNGSDCPYNGAFGQWRCNYKGKDRCKAFIDTRAFRYSDISSINKTIFVSKEAAEARLAELKGEKK